MTESVTGLNVSVCLIVRNEQSRLTDCLESARRFATELIVCDTGSDDATPEVAAAAGARVVCAPWRDDFAAARNVALDACRGDWVLSLDADEIVAGMPAWLAVMLAACGTDLDALTVEIDNSSAPDLAAGVHREQKLFRRAACRWDGRVHERLVRRDGLAVRSADLPIGTLRIAHHGYDDIATARAKGARNARLAELQLAELRSAGAEPEAIAEVALHLGRSQAGLGRADLAVAPLRLAARDGSWHVRYWAEQFLAKCATEAVTVSQSPQPVGVGSSGHRDNTRAIASRSAAVTHRP